MPGVDHLTDRRLRVAALTLVVALAGAGCSSGPERGEFVDEMTSKAAAGFTAESFWGCVYDKTDGDTHSELMDLDFGEIGTADEDLSRRVSAVMGECLGVDLTPTTTITETTAPDEASTTAPTG